MNKILVALAVFFLASFSFAACTVSMSQAIVNSSSTVTTTISPVISYNYTWTDYNGTTVQVASNNSTYYIPSSFNGSRVYVYATSPTNNCSNYSLVYSGAQQTVQNNLFSNNIIDWFKPIAALALAIFSVGISYGITAKIGHTCVTASVMWVGLYMILASPLFVLAVPALLYGAIVLLVAGLVLTYANV
jgi:hypothetical protein